MIRNLRLITKKLHLILHTPEKFGWKIFPYSKCYNTKNLNFVKFKNNGLKYLLNSRRHLLSAWHLFTASLQKALTWTINIDIKKITRENQYISNFMKWLFQTNQIIRHCSTTTSHASELRRQSNRIKDIFEYTQLSIYARLKGDRPLRMLFVLDRLV